MTLACYSLAAFVAANTGHFEEARELSLKVWSQTYLSMPGLQCWIPPCKAQSPRNELKEAESIASGR